MNAMQQHRVAKSYDPGIAQILNSLVLNNVEVLTWNGIPLILLAVYALFRSARRLTNNQSLPLDGLTVPLVVTYIILNFTGQTDGEVQRLWLFMLPLWSIYSAEFARTLTSRKITGISLIVTLELITTFLCLNFKIFMDKAGRNQQVVLHLVVLKSFQGVQQHPKLFPAVFTVVEVILNRWHYYPGTFPASLISANWSRTLKHSVQPISLVSSDRICWMIFLSSSGCRITNSPANIGWS